MVNFSINRGNIKSVELENVSLTFTELTKLLTVPVITPDKLNAGYFLRCNGTRRGDKTVSDLASLLILDGDSRYCHDGKTWNGAINPRLMHELFKSEGINHIIYTSHSHNVDLFKYRVAIPVQYNRNQLDALLWHLFAVLHENELMLVDVKENHTWAQAWFFHSYPKEREHLAQTFVFDGGSDGALNVAQIEADYAKHLAWLKAFEPAPQIKQQRVIESSKVESINDGFIDPIQAFNEAVTIDEVLTANGYKHEGRGRYLHPNSTSKIAGVRILENGKVYSDSNDALNDGYSHDAFDCFVLLNCNGDKRLALNWNPQITKHNQKIYKDSQTENPQQSKTATGLNSVRITQC